MRRHARSPAISLRISLAALVALAVLAVLAASAFAQAPPPASPPAAIAELPHAPTTRMEVVRDTLHGTVVADPYRWLEDQNAPETRAWLAKQDDYLHRVMANVPGRDSLHARLEQLLRTDDVGLPTERQGKLFFMRRGAGEERRVLMLRPATGGKDQVLLDPATLGASGNASLRLMDVSINGTIAAVGIQKGGEDEVEVAFLDVAGRKLRADRLPRARYLSVQFGGDGRTVYYARFGPEGPRLLAHTLGASPARDAVLFGDQLGPEKLLSASVSDDGAWLLISVRHGSAGDQVDLYVKDLRKNGPITTIVDDLPARFDGRIGGNTLFLRTNWKAPKQRILAVDLAHPARDQWREVLREGEHVIDSWSLAGGRLLVNYLINVVAQVYLVGADGTVAGQVPIGQTCAVRGISGRWGSEEAYLAYESFNLPPRIIRIFPATNDTEPWWSSSVPFRGEDYEVKQVWCSSKDGTRVPMFLCHRRVLVRDGKNPVYLTGYGGFALNRVPRFSTTAALWMENGGIWAEATLRGGAEFGEAWHSGGMLAKKQNVFDDFIAATEWLVQSRYTSKDRLAIGGGSNGGLLVGAALTQRPDLFRAVVCSAPLLDMVRYDKFLVARFWVPEYGSSADSAQFRSLLAYSPYHHVKIGAPYPAVMFVSGDSDTRVDPLHARKMAALVQSATGSDRPVLLHYDTSSGHSGGKAVSRQIEDDADTMQFLFWQLGMTARSGAPPPLPPVRDARGER